MASTPRFLTILAISYVGLAILANWLAAEYVWNVPLTDLKAPAGVFCIGAVLVIRDWIQQVAGLAISLALVPIAGILSYIAATALGWTDLQRIAVASIIAFLVSEGLEAVVFTPVRRRSVSLGVLSSGIVGSVIDSYIFLTIAFSSLAFFDGQVVAKVEMVIVGTILTVARRSFVPVGVRP